MLRVDPIPWLMAQDGPAALRARCRLGIHRDGDDEAVRSAVARLLAEQRPDGGFEGSVIKTAGVLSLLGDLAVPGDACLRRRAAGYLLSALETQPGYERAKGAGHAEDERLEPALNALLGAQRESGGWCRNLGGHPSCTIHAIRALGAHPGLRKSRHAERALEFARAHGFSGVQAAVEAPHLAFEGMSDAECERLARSCSETGLRIALHAPDDACSLFLTSPWLREGAFCYFEALFRFGERIGSRLITVHTGGFVHFRTDTSPRTLVPPEDLDAYRRAFAGNLARLIDLASGRFTLCLENSSFTHGVADILAPHLEAGGLALCWDLAKTYGPRMQIETQLEAFYWRNVHHIRQVHLHDIRDGLSHAVVGSGGVDFLRFLPRLAAEAVEDYCIEVRPREKAVESLANLRRMVEGAEEARA